MINKDTTFEGTKLKYLLEIEATGFNMETDDFNVTLKRGGKELHFEKADLVVEPYNEVDPETNISTEKHHYYVCFDSAYFGPGAITVVVTMYVPDNAFDDGFRTIVDKFNLVNVLAV